MSRSRPFKALVKAEENESEDENEGEAIAAEARNTHKRKRDDYNLDGNEPASGSEDEEDQPIQQQEPAGNKPTGSSKRKSAMDLVSGHLDEEMLKRSARDLAHEPIRQAASSKLQSDLVKLEGHKWRFFLTRGGHSLLFYGFGSKLELLERFAREVLTDGIVLAVHGYRPMIKVRQALLPSYPPTLLPSLPVLLPRSILI